MDRRFRRGFTAAEKTKLWDRWQRGALKAIGRPRKHQAMVLEHYAAEPDVLIDELKKDITREHAQEEYKQAGPKDRRSQERLQK